jgi:hypothetical protein
MKMMILLASKDVDAEAFESLIVSNSIPTAASVNLSQGTVHASKRVVREWLKTLRAKPSFAREELAELILAAALEEVR